MIKKTHRARNPRSARGKPRTKRRSSMVEVVAGRTRFKKGNPGKPKGSKDKLPGGRSIKASIKAIIERVVENEGETIESALIDGLSGGARFAHNYLRLCAEYTDGKPAETLNLNSQYNEDELAQAKDRLDRKVAQLAATILKRDTVDPPTTEEPDGQ